MAAILRASRAELLDEASLIGAAVRDDQQLREAAILFVDAQQALALHMNAQTPSRSIDVIFKARRRRKWHRSFVIAFWAITLPVVGVIVGLMVIAGIEIVRELLS